MLYLITLEHYEKVQGVETSCHRVEFLKQADSLESAERKLHEELRGAYSLRSGSGTRGRRIISVVEATETFPLEKAQAVVDQLVDGNIELTEELEKGLRGYEFQYDRCWEKSIKGLLKSLKRCFHPKVVRVTI
jgi:hypothetical protein